MSGSPTEPLSYTATELAFELDVVKSMCGTVLDSSTNSYCRTSCTNKVFFFVFSLILSFLLVLFTIFHTSEIRLLAFVAFIVRKLEHTVILKFVMVSVVRILQFLMFIDTLMLASFYCFFLQVFLIALCLY